MLTQVRTCRQLSFSVRYPRNRSLELITGITENAPRNQQTQGGSRRAYIRLRCAMLCQPALDSMAGQTIDLSSDYYHGSQAVMADWLLWASFVCWIGPCVPPMQDGRQLQLCSDKQWKDLVWGFAMQVGGSCMTKAWTVVRCTWHPLAAWVLLPSLIYVEALIISGRHCGVRCTHAYNTLKTTQCTF